jgi:hypothetical protein
LAFIQEEEDLKLAVALFQEEQDQKLAVALTQEEQDRLLALKSVNSNFTHKNLDRPRLTFCLMLGKKREKIWLGQDLSLQSVDEKSIVLTITPLAPCC